MSRSMYELLQKLNEDYSKVVKRNDILDKKVDDILLNQDEIIVKQEYGNCLLELNQTV